MTGADVRVAPGVDTSVVERAGRGPLPVPARDTRRTNVSAGGKLADRRADAARGREREVIVLYEDDKRTERLLVELRKVCASVLPLHALNEAQMRSTYADLQHRAAADLPVVWSRLSASAHSRGHGEALRRGVVWLRKVEELGCVMLNGTAALALEISKSAQVRCCHSIGLEAPATFLAPKEDDVRRGARHFDGAVFLKPDCGGSGSGVHMYSSGRALLTALDRSGGTILKAATERAGGWVLQEAVDGTEPTRVETLLARGKVKVEMLRCRYRLELIGGCVHHLVRIVALRGVTVLCPCDRFNKAEVLIEVVDPIVEFGSRLQDRWGRFVACCEALAAASGFQVGCVEFALRASDNVFVAYDVNTNTNYSDDAEESAVRAGLLDQTGPEAVASMVHNACLRSPLTNQLGRDGGFAVVEVTGGASTAAGPEVHGSAAARLESAPTGVPRPTEGSRPAVVTAAATGRGGSAEVSHQRRVAAAHLVSMRRPVKSCDRRCPDGIGTYRIFGL